MYDVDKAYTAYTQRQTFEEVGWHLHRLLFEEIAFNLLQKNLNHFFESVR